MLRAGLRASPIDVLRQWAAWRQWPASDLVPLTIFVLLALMPALASLGSEIYLLNLFTRVMIFAIAALALDLIVGYGALVSFGHAAFIGLGAYAVGILAFHGMNEVLLSLPLAIAVAGLFAIATGFVCLRTRGVYFIMITLAFGQMAFFTASSLAPYGGDDGLTIHARDTLLGFPVLGSDRALYYIVLLCLLGSFFLCRAIVLSRFGRVLRGARENPTRMAAIGFEIFRYQLIAYAISGALAGLSGFLLANATEFVSPAYMSWQRSGELIIMVLLGGMGTLYGAIIGAAAFLLTEEWLSGLTEHWKVIFGPLLVIVVVFARGGLVGLVPQVVRALRGDPLGRTSAVFAKLRADFVRRVSLGVQGARHGSVGFSAQLVPMVSAITARIAMPPRVNTSTEGVAARLVSILQEAFALRFALAKQCGAILQRVSLGTEHARRGLVAFAGRLTPVIQATSARLATLPPRVHSSAERLAARLKPILRFYREALERGSALADEHCAQLLRRLSLATQGARRGLVAFAARLTPVIQAATARMAVLRPRVHSSAERLAARLTPILQSYRAAFERGSSLASEQRAHVFRRVSRGAQSAQRGLVAFAARLTPVIRAMTARIALLPPRVHSSVERLAVRLTPLLHTSREAFARGSTPAAKLSADLARRVLLRARETRRGLVALAARFEPIIQNGTERAAATLAARSYAIRNRLSSRLAPRVHTYCEAVTRLTRRLAGEIAGIRSELTRRLRGG
jgi:branched-chain amino acid transport system permease protein